MRAYQLSPHWIHIGAAEADGPDACNVKMTARTHFCHPKSPRSGKNRFGYPKRMVPLQLPSCHELPDNLRYDRGFPLINCPSALLDPITFPNESRPAAGSPGAITGPFPTAWPSSPKHSRAASSTLDSFRAIFSPPGAHAVQPLSEAAFISKSGGLGFDLAVRQRASHSQ